MSGEELPGEEMPGEENDRSSMISRMLHQYEMQLMMLEQARKRQIMREMSESRSVPWSTAPTKPKDVENDSSSQQKDSFGVFLSHQNVRHIRTQL